MNDMAMNDMSEKAESVSSKMPHSGDEHGDNGRPVVSALHPRVYAVVMGLACWLVLSLWLFAGGGPVDYLLFIVGGFIFIAVMLPLILSQVTRMDGATPERDTQRSYRDWAASEFDTWQGRLTGRAAAVQILLPIAAVAIGMTLFGIALHVAEHESAQQQATYSSGSVVKNSG